MSYEVNEPILNSPFDEPSHYWFIREGYEPELKEGRRPSIVYPPRMVQLMMLTFGRVNGFMMWFTRILIVW